MLCIAQVLAWLMGDGRELSLNGSKAMSIASYGDEDPARDAILGSAGGGAEQVRFSFLFVPCIWFVSRKSAVAASVHCTAALCSSAFVPFTCGCPDSQSEVHLCLDP